jgi:hypothetical protein
MTSRQTSGAHGWLLSLKPNPQMPTTGRPFCRAYAVELVWVDILEVQSVLISDCMFVQPVTSYMT